MDRNNKAKTPQAPPTNPVGDGGNQPAATPATHPAEGAGDGGNLPTSDLARLLEAICREWCCRMGIC